MSHENSPRNNNTPAGISASANSAPQSSTPAKPIQIKVVLLGEAAVGKSSLVLRFVNDEFQENKEPTIGAAFLTQKVRLDDSVLKLDIWDTAGQERFHSLAPMYYRNAQAAVVLDLAGDAGGASATKATTADEAEASEADADEQADTEGRSRQVATATARAYAEETGLLFLEASAKTGEGVVETFTEIAKKLDLNQIANNNRAARSGQLNSGSVNVNLMGDAAFGTDGSEGSARANADSCTC
ncbi:ras family-domain-containing protein [Kickxella alabastrina]|uniref:ras family-domain-containing protein n=1 Tax=Kickxella alabastrina TaxID=61397 RepID=UPI002220D9B2|nr:ras family-domain-containing protein [Kickxella alabastrina]KAI7834376.1 ras family-domain-containing protein [Kickxella alabastrina]